ncbi:hypothetical protein JCM16161A_13570 [Vulcanisaeta sp. JCM 16161]
MIWDSILVYIGYAFATQWSLIMGLIDRYLYVVAVAVTIVIIMYIVLKHCVKPGRGDSAEA